MKQTIKKVFIPHDKHNPQPLFWHPFSIGFVVLVLLLISGILTSQKIETNNNQSLLGDIRSGAIISLTNKERDEVGLPTLIESETLNQAAVLKAQDMAQGDYFAHYSPTGLSPWFWFTKAGYEYQRAGENLAVNFNDSKKIVNAWMNSPAHKANIVKDGYTEIGIGTAEGVYKGKSATFIVQLFATPRIDTSSSALAFSIEKKSSIEKTEQSSVRGAEVVVISSTNILQLLSSQTYISIIILALLSLVSILAILTLLIRWKHHNKKFTLSIVILVLVLVISIYVQFIFLKDISVAFLE